MKLVGELFDGPIDIVGDVHGEIDGLTRLLRKLGYDAAGRHADDRRLVFLGDLTDRGPDSPAVLELVAGLVTSGRAQSIAGNHELNLLRGDTKHGNAWWTKPGQPDEHPQLEVTPEQRDRFEPFLVGLPLALERDDLRVVHACWSAPDIERIRSRESEESGICALHDEYMAEIERAWTTPERTRARDGELEGIDLNDGSVVPPLLRLHADHEAALQTSNPIKVLTSGIETPTEEPFYTSGKWRMVERVKWWNDYREGIPVVVGHYWRRYDELDSANPEKDGPDLFDDVAPHEWMGAQSNVYCVDFSVGRRPKLRADNRPEGIGQLAALRVPEWRVVHDDGGEWEIGEPGRSQKSLV